MDTADSNLLDRIKRNEADLGCRVDTKVRRLSVDHIEDRRKLLTFPVADGFESGCYGWKMAPVPLRLGAWDAAPQIEWITKGDDLLFDHEGDDGWDFVTLMRDGRRIGFGWFSATYDEKSCESFAG